MPVTVTETRTREQLRQHYEVERELADRLRHVIGEPFIFLITRAIILTLVLTSCSSTTTPVSSRTTPLDPYAGPRPIAVLFSTSGWDPVGYVPTPHVAVYEDGQVIFTSWSAFTPHYLTLTLTSSELTDLRQQVHDLATLRPQRDIFDTYEALDEGHIVYDTSTYCFYVRDGRREAIISVYALSHVLSSQFPLRREQDGGPPAALLAVYRRLEALRSTPASASALKSWTPRYVEVRLSDETRNRSKRIVSWPADWPALTSSRARQRGPDAWSVLIDGTQLPRLRRVLAADADFAAITLGGKIWAALWRPMLPGQSIWITAFRKRYDRIVRRERLSPSSSHDRDPWITS